MGCGGLLVRLDRSGELLLASATGVMTPRASDYMREVIIEALAHEDARALVVNLTDAVPLMSPGWRELSESRLAQDIGPPMAVVMSPMYERELRAYCLRMAVNYGLVRGPFTDVPSALSWASSQRDHWPEPPAALPPRAVAPAHCQSRPSARKQRTASPASRA